MISERLDKAIREVPNFPKEGINFKDITPLLMDSELTNGIIDAFINQLNGIKLDAIVGIESRGFIFAAPLSLKLGCKFALARKPGKLPYNTISEEYELEYGTDAIEMHKDAIIDGDRVLIVDDLLATGGTANATGSLVKRLNGKIISYAFVIELVELNGTGLLDVNSVYSIVKY